MSSGKELIVKRLMYLSPNGEKYIGRLTIADKAFTFVSKELRPLNNQMMQSPEEYVSQFPFSEISSFSFKKMFFGNQFTFSSKGKVHTFKGSKLNKQYVMMALNNQL